MEHASTWELKVLTNELAQGMEKAMQLRLHLCSTSPSEAEDLILQRIISTFEKALCILKWSGHAGVAQVGVPSSAAPESSISADGSSRSDDMNKSFTDYQDRGDASKKRKLQTTWTEQVKVNPENGLEGPGEDGYSWRKYGQKDILGAKHPRSYYRCTYRQGRNCWATKQVQRSDEDPTIFEITYKGTHTCKQFQNAAPPPASPEKQEQKSNNSCYDQLEQNPILSKFKSNLRVNTEVVDIQEMPAHFSFPSTFACHEKENHCSPISAMAEDNNLGAYSPLFYSPATSGSNCFSTATYQMPDYGGIPMQHSETDIADIMSANASTTNSPIGGMEFSIDPVEIDQIFPFNTPGFFT
ncbi:hypothetical protein C2S52_008356 [Perilla frutescens var. hirtella]|nr:hypothetical protein C2S51_017897 [Perilla frutescens var. frutescens]KAH6783397.1 hypothetical protein C2S52_008356 [Perilla frutescens var. hirtella]